MAYTILHDTRLALANTMGKLPLGFFNDRTTSTIKKVIHEDVENLEEGLAHMIPDMVSGLLRSRSENRVSRDQKALGDVWRTQRRAVGGPCSSAQTASTQKEGVDIYRQVGNLPMPMSTFACQMSRCPNATICTCARL
jgi:hypothetical protein